MSDQRFSDYIDVAERISAFYGIFPTGSLQPLDPHEPFRIIQPYGADGPQMLVYVAAAYRSSDDERPGIGMAWELLPGRTPYTKGSELMVAETSAWGRAIAALGIATKRSIATKQEVDAAKSRQIQRTTPTAPVDDAWTVAPNA